MKATVKKTTKKAILAAMKAAADKNTADLSGKAGKPVSASPKQNFMAMTTRPYIATDKAHKAWVGRTMGYTLDASGDVKVDLKQQMALAYIFHNLDTNSGLTYRQIAENLNKVGYKTKKGKDFKDFTVGDIVRKRAQYMGYRPNHNIYVAENLKTPIVTGPTKCYMNEVVGINNTPQKA